jgi:hypothetical protein
MPILGSAELNRISYREVLWYALLVERFALRSHEDPVAVVRAPLRLPEREAYALGGVYRVLAYEAGLGDAGLHAASAVEDTKLEECSERDRNY